MTVPIQISAWNINGFKSKLIGDKLNDTSFLNEIQNDDIIAIVETHNSDKNDTLSIPGYQRIEMKNRPKLNNSNKNSGGLAYFAKPYISKHISPINNLNKNSIWIRIKKDIVGNRQDIFVGTVYLPPHKNKGDSSKKILDLFEEIVSFQKKGEVIVQGDFNARTGICNDRIIPDKFDTILMNNGSIDVPNRNSQDKVPADHRGKELIELCKSLEMVILNGRKIGDLFGKFTSLQWNGNSVVDYVLASQSLYSSISYFKIGNFIPWLSDHCATRFRLNSNLACVSRSNVEKSREELESIFWDTETSPEKFISILSAREQEIGEILSPQTVNPLENFQDLMKIVISEGKFKMKKKKASNDAPWFDKDCENAKMEIRTIGGSIQSTPSDPSLRKKLTEKKKKFRQLTRIKKRQYEKTIFDNMLEFDRMKESKKFWLSLNKLNREKEVDYVSYISHESWVDHFQKVRRADNDPNYPPDDDTDGPLDYGITLEELNKAKNILKNGKKWGVDLISYEMLKCVLEYNPSIILKVLNFVLLNNITAHAWYVSLIAPIHKKGSKMNPDNYRGISLISCLYKLLTAILNTRLGIFCKENNILSLRQLGFVSGNRTSDAHFILHNLTRDYCYHNGKKLFSCFVDFSKAFDCIPRDILFEKLKSKGITGKVFNLIKNIYVNEKCQVKIGNTLSSAFEANQGVRQGCILSPLLFNIFISDLPEILDNDKNEPAMIGTTTKMSCILWADDLVMFSESKNGLTNMLNDLAEFSCKNGLKINSDKTKCMFFNKTGRHKILNKYWKYDN